VNNYAIKSFVVFIRTF